MKRRVKLTESDLKNLVKESVQTILYEFNHMTANYGFSGSKDIEGTLYLTTGMVLAHLDDNLSEDLVEEIKNACDAVVEGASFSVSGTLYIEEDVNYRSIEDAYVDESDVETCIQEVEADEETTPEAKSYIIAAVKDIADSIYDYKDDVDWREW